MMIAGAFAFAIAATAVIANWVAFYIGIALLIIGAVVLVVGVIRHRGRARRGSGHRSKGHPQLERSQPRVNSTPTEDLLQRFRMPEPSTAHGASESRE
jgi:fatty acid desaturase